MTGPGLSARPLRADAVRNHRAIVAAAREAFDELGSDVPLEEVARRAGVGASTLYRRFAGRDELVAAVFAEYFEEAVEPVLARAGAEPDPQRAVAEVVEGIARAMVHRRAFMRAARDAGAFTPEIVLRFVGPLQDLLARAKAAGVVRDDLEVGDLSAVATMLVATGAPFDELAPDRWERYRALVLDALHPSAARAPLPPLAPLPDDEVSRRLAARSASPPEPT